MTRLETLTLHYHQVLKLRTETISSLSYGGQIPYEKIKEEYNYLLEGFSDQIYAIACEIALEISANEHEFHQLSIHDYIEACNNQDILTYGYEIYADIEELPVVDLVASDEYIQYLINETEVLECDGKGNLYIA
jgi:hypothetical protein